MIRKFLERIVEAVAAPSNAEHDAGVRDAAIRMATAVLMVDVARADDVFEQSEFERVLQLVQIHFSLSPEEAAELVNLANDKAEQLTSAYEFTSILHQHLNAEEEARIVGMLWQIAYADGQLDKYEDSLVLKISDLLHVSRGLVMRLKYDAATAAGQGDLLS